MKLDLSKKSWPTNLKHDARVVQSVGDPWSNVICPSVHRQFVQEGTMIAMPMAFPHMSNPIRRNECAITALAVARTQAIYGGTSGKKSHLFCAMIQGATGFVHDMTTIDGATECVAVGIGCDERVYACVNCASSGWIVSNKQLPTPFDCIQEWWIARSPCERFVEPVAGRKFVHAVMADEGKQIVALLDDGMLICVEVPSGEVTILGEVETSGRLGARIFVDSHHGRGTVYGTCFGGRIWQYDLADRVFEKWDVCIPCGPGREHYNGVSTWAFDGDRRELYGASQSDGTLFGINLATRDVRSLGQIDSFSPVNAMSVTTDGRLFGIAGGKDDVGRLFVYDPQRHELRDLGIAISVLGARVYGFVFGCATTWKDGAIVLGEADATSHLWVYFPAIKLVHKV
jgi:hypothetical protein